MSALQRALICLVALPVVVLALAHTALAAPPTNVGPPLISGAFQVGQTLTASPGDWLVADSYAYQWQRCSSYSDAVLADSPAGFWRLGDAAGTTMNDSSGAGRSGSYASTGISPGQPGALSGDSDTSSTFDGAGGYATVPDSAALKPASVTVEAWVKTTAASGTIAAKPYIAGSSVSYALQISAGKAVMAVTTTTGSYSAVSIASVNDGNWHLIAGSFDATGNSVNVGIDGATGATTATNGALLYGTNPLQVGRTDATAAQYFNGQLDELAIYPTALSAARTAAHYQAGTTAVGASPCADIGGATDTIYNLTAADIGKRLRVNVTATDADGSTSATSYATVVAGAAPLNSGLPTITGNFWQGQTVTASTGNWSGAQPVSYAYQWLRCGDYSQWTYNNVYPYPVDYYRFGDSGGSSVLDSGTAPDNGTINGGVTLGQPGALAGDPNTALTLDGSTGYIQLATPVTLGSADFTVEGWFKTTATSAGGTIWQSGYNGTSPATVDIYLDTGGVLRAIARDAANNTVNLVTSSSYNNGAWHHFAFSRSSSYFSLYLDGALTATSITPLGAVDSSGVSPHIGDAIQNTSGSFFAGSLDELAVYPENLSGGNVSDHYGRAFCTPVSGATAATYTIGGYADTNYHLIVKVTASNAAGTGVAQSLESPIMTDSNGASPKMSAYPASTGSSVLGGTLAVSSGTWEGPQPITYSYQWLRCQDFVDAAEQDSPLGYWRLGETSGTTAADLGSGSNPGTYTGGVTLNQTGALAGDSNTAVLLDGTSGYVQLANSTQFDNGSFTVAAWFASTTTTGTQTLWESGNSTGSQYVRIQMDPGGKMEADVSDGTKTTQLVYPSVSYNNGNWHQVALTRAPSGGYMLYLDGNAVMSAVNGPSGDVDAAGARPRIGATEAGTNFWNGRIDDVTVYSTALPSTRISQDARQCAAISGATSMTHTNVAADLGHQLQVFITVANPNGSVVYTTPLSPAISSPTVLFMWTPPVVTGTALPGQVLTSTAGAWTGAQPITYAYQWQRCPDYVGAVNQAAPLDFWHLDEMSGTTIADSGMGANPGTLSNASFGNLGALQGDYDTSILLPMATMTKPLAFGSSDFSIEGWFTQQANPVANGVTLWQSGYDGTHPPIVRLYLDSAQHLNALVRDSTASVTLTSTQTFPSSPNWHYFALVRSGNSFTLYIDGVAAAAASAALGAVDSPGVRPTIGQSGAYWTGKLDELAVYLSALSASTVQGHYGLAGPCTSIPGATGTSYTVAAGDGGYRIRTSVKVTNSYGSLTANSAETTGVMVSTTLSAASPLDSAGVHTATPTLTVNPLTGLGAVSYAFQVATDRAFANVVAQSALLPSNTYQVPASANLADGQTYYWRAQAQYSAGTTAWTAGRSFDVRTLRFGSKQYWPMWSSGPLSVNEATGNVVLNLAGPTYSSAAGTMAISFAYNSLDTGNRGLGAGWTLTGGDFSGDPPARLIDHSASGAPAPALDSVELVHSDGSSTWYSHIGLTNTYLSGPGDSSQLSKNTDGSWTWIDTDGTVYSFASSGAGGIYAPVSAESRDEKPGKGTLRYTFDVSSSVPKLTKLTDGADTSRAITLTWNSLNASGCPNAIVCISGPDGVTWQLVGDAGGSGRLMKITRVNGAASRDLASYGYDANGRLSVVKNADDLNPTDPNVSPNYNAAHAVAISYDSAGRAVQISDGPITNQTPAASTWSFNYYTAGPYSITPTRAAHADTGAAGAARQAVGYTTVEPPDQQGQPAPKVATVYYDSHDHPMEVDDVLGHVTETSYDSADRLLWSEDADGNPTDNTWDTFNNVLLKTQGPVPGGGLTTRPTTIYRFDETNVGTASAAGPALGGLQAQYFANKSFSGRPAFTTDPNVDFKWGESGPSVLGGTSIAYSVRWKGNLNAPTEGDYLFTLDLNGGGRLVVDGSQVINVATSSNATYSVAYPSPLVHLTAGLHRLTFEYIETHALGEVHLHWRCDNCATPIADAVIPSSALQPGWENLTSTVSPGGRIVFGHYADPAAGHPDYMLAQPGDGTNLVTSYTYDGYGRMTQKVMPKGNAARTIDSGGNLSGAIDTAYATSYSYYAPGASATPPATCGGASADQAGLLASLQPHGMASTVYVYDAAGRTVASTNGRGTTCHTFDAQGRLTSERAPGDAQATTYAYDPAGNVRSATDASGTITTRYDEAGRPVDKVDSFGAEGSFSYDADGNVTRRVVATGALSSNTNYVTSYSYDAANDLTSLTDPAGRVYSFFYDSRGNLKATQYPNATFSWVDTNPVGSVTGVYNRHGTLTGPLPSSVPADSQSSPIVDFAYQYNQDGQQTQAIRTGGGLTTQTTGYAYDGLGRLSQVVLPTGVTRSYSFDADSNRTAITENGSTVASYSYNPSTTPGTDQLTSVTQGGVTTGYTYTADGQVKTRGADTVTWDGWGHMTGGTFNGAAVTYGYDPSGHRRSRVASGQTTQYLLGDLIETDGAGTITTSYVDGPAGNLASFAGPPSAASTVTYLYYSGHGDTAATADSSGSRIASPTYDPFGAPLDVPPANATSQLWTGRWGKLYDSGDALVEMGARPYDPATGRFWAVDPVQGGSLNAYDYAGGDPVNGSDLGGTMRADVTGPDLQVYQTVFVDCVNNKFGCKPLNNDPPVEIDVNILTVATPEGGFTVGVTIDASGYHPYVGLAQGQLVSGPSVSVSIGTPTPGGGLVVNACSSIVCVSKTVSGPVSSGWGIGFGADWGLDIEQRWTCTWSGCHKK